MYFQYVRDDISPTLNSIWRERFRNGLKRSWKGRFSFNLTAVLPLFFYRLHATGGPPQGHWLLWSCLITEIITVQRTQYLLSWHWPAIPSQQKNTTLFFFPISGYFCCFVFHVNYFCRALVCHSTWKSHRLTVWSWEPKGDTGHRGRQPGRTAIASWRLGKDNQSETCRRDSSDWWVPRKC